MSGISTNGMTLATPPLTGNEQAAFDTTLPSGEQPETEAISIAQISGFVSAPKTLTDGATIALSAGTQDQLYQLTLTGNHTLANPTGLVAGQVFRVEVTQDATGARTLTYGTLFKWVGAAAPTLTTTPAAIDLLTFVYDGTVLLGSGQLHYA